MNWICGAYRGFAWPYLVFLSAAGWGAGLAVHGWWHDTAWPCLAICVVAVNVAAAKIAKGMPDDDAS